MQAAISQARARGAEVEAANAMAARPHPRGFVFRVCAFLLLATALSYLDRQALGLVAPRVGEELHLDNTGLGHLLSAFFWAYGFMHLFVGWFLDRLAIRRTYATFVGLWSLAQIAAGLARGFGSLYGTRLLLGVFEAAAQPGAARIIVRLVPHRDRTLANGIMMSGGSLGAILAAPLMLGLADTVGWRLGFVVLGALGLLWMLGWLLWAWPRGTGLEGGEAHAPSAGAAPRTLEPWGPILRDRRFWACAWGALLVIPMIHVVGSWVPTFLQQTWNVPVTAGLAGYLMICFVGLDLGFIAGGATVSVLVRRGMGVMAARKLVMLLAAVLMALAAIVPRAPSLLAAVLLVAAMNAGRAAWGAVFLGFNQDVSRTRIGTIAGLMGAIGAFAGAAYVTAMGYVSSRFGFTVPFVLLGLLAVAGTVPLLLVRWEGSKT